MTAFNAWLATRGPEIAKSLDSQRDQICGIVSTRLATVFPTLCYDTSRPDAAYFQQHTFVEVPRRFQRVLQAVLMFQSLAVMEQEYRWGWSILPSYGVTRQHMLTQVRWYFDALRISLPLDAADSLHLSTLEGSILEIIDRITMVDLVEYRQPLIKEHNKKRRLNGTHSH